MGSTLRHTMCSGGKIKAPFCGAGHAAEKVGAP
jgi:hypothetical protein